MRSHIQDYFGGVGGGQSVADVRRIQLDKNIDGRNDVMGLRKVYDWVENDKGKTVLMSGIQTVGGKYWE